MISLAMLHLERVLFAVISDILVNTWITLRNSTNTLRNTRKTLGNATNILRNTRNTRSTLRNKRDTPRNTIEKYTEHNEHTGRKGIN